MINFTNVTYSYSDGKPSLDNISLDIKTGERVSLVGNNGSGKTTLALLINGILKPTTGTVNVAGLNPSDESGSAGLKQKVGLVFQNPDNQLVSTTVEREVAFSLENQNVPQQEIVERVYDLLKYFGLYKMRTNLTSELSGGEKQRLALASVMIIKPDILILDEPGSFLDESGKEMMKNAVGGLMEENNNLTLIHISQYVRTALLYKRMICLSNGKVLADGNAGDIISNQGLHSKLGIDIPIEHLSKKSLERKLSDCRQDNKTLKANLVSCENLSFNYNSQSENDAVNDLSLEISSNEIYGIVGCSGSGKSTTVQLLAGLMKPSAGKIEYRGLDGSKSPIAVAFQQAERQFFLETVDAEIRFGAENMKIENIDEVIDECYRSIGLSREAFAERMPFDLSGGEKRRLSFGTLLAMQPSFIFFDEPTCGLDAGGVLEFTALANKLKNKGIGVSFISHDGDLIFNLADKVINLDRGKLTGVYSKETFFKEVNYSAYLSEPSAITYQKTRFGEVKYYNQNSLFSEIVNGD